MTSPKKPLDPNLASILDSIRATVGGEAPGGDEPLPDRGETPPAPVRRGPPPPQLTVEEFLAEMIRPQVKAWLDAHLPEIIQKLASEEIERLTRGK
jgi:hypothetical protein